MGLFGKETEQQMVKRLAGHAGPIIAMFKDVFTGPKGLDARSCLIFSAAVAGYACHQAVLAENGTFAVATTVHGKKFYFGDDVNRHLLEREASVVAFCTAVTKIPRNTVLAIVTAFTQSIGDKDLTICGMDPGYLYDQVAQCWDGIYNNMTKNYCKSPSEWPVLFGIVLQNILVLAMQAGAPAEEAGKIAIETAVAVSKMDKDSF